MILEGSNYLALLLFFKILLVTASVSPRYLAVEGLSPRKETTVSIWA